MRSLYPAAIRRLFLLVLSYNVSFCLISAQTAYVNYAGNTIRNVVLYNDACGPTFPQIPQFPGAGFLIPPPFPAGGLALDQTANVIYETNGRAIKAVISPLYSQCCPINASFFTPLGVTVPAPLALATALAIQPLCGLTFSAGVPSILWVSDGSLLIGINTLTALPIGVAVPIIGLGGGEFVTGLEYDTINNRLLGVTQTGVTYNILTTGFVVGAPIPPPGTYTGSSPVVANVFDRGAGPSGSYYILDGRGVLHPTFGLYAGFPTIPTGTMLGGASFSAEPVVLDSGCVCPDYPVNIFTTKPPVCDLIASFDIALQTGPFVPAILLIDFQCCPIQFLPVISPCTIWPCLTTAALFNTVADSAGVAIGLSAGTIPCFFTGLTAYAQWAVPCNNGFGFSLSHAFHIRISNP